MKTPWSSAILACGYGIVLGLHFGLVLGLRLNPKIFNHCCPQPYLLLILLFAVVLHSSRRLSARASWVAYLLCCLTFICTALVLDRSAIFKTPTAILALRAQIVVGFFGLSGLAAQGMGLAVRRWLLPSEERSTRMMNVALPWLPLVVLLVLTIHLVERYAAHGSICNQRFQYQRESEHAHNVAISLLARGRTTSLRKGTITVHLALYRDRFPLKEPVEAVIAMANDGPEGVYLRRPLEFAQWLRVDGPDGNAIPFNEPTEWQVTDIGIAPLRIGGMQHVGFFVPIQPWFTLGKQGKYSVSLAWDERESEKLEFTVGEDAGKPPAKREGPEAGAAAEPKVLTEAEARKLAASFANEQLKGKTFEGMDGEKVPPPEIKPEHWRVAEKKDGRWRLAEDPPAGFTFVVTMNLDGSKPVLEQACLALK